MSDKDNEAFLAKIGQVKPAAKEAKKEEEK